jgi:hypothetical protein
VHSTAFHRRCRVDLVARDDRAMLAVRGFDHVLRGEREVRIREDSEGEVGADGVVEVLKRLAAECGEERSCCTLYGLLSPTTRATREAGYTIAFADVLLWTYRRALWRMTAVPGCAEGGCQIAVLALRQSFGSSVWLENRSGDRQLSVSTWVGRQIRWNRSSGSVVTVGQSSRSTLRSIDVNVSQSNSSP